MLSWIIGIIFASQLNFFFRPLALPAEIADYDSVSPRRLVTLSIAPLINAPSALVMDKKTGKVLYEKQAHLSRPIASITKLMTALVSLENNADLNKKIVIRENDLHNGGIFVLPTAEKVSHLDLLNIALVGSVNSAAEALSRSGDLTPAQFAALMNSKAKSIGMAETIFSEPTGLDSGNRSTAFDTALLLKTAAENKLISEILKKKQYEYTLNSGKKITIINTNELLKSYLPVAGGKTGYIEEAGYCLTNIFNLPDAEDNPAEEGIIVVVLGSASAEERFAESKFLAGWIFDNWTWND